MHCMYVFAACYYAGMVAKRLVSLVSKSTRAQECSKGYKKVVPKGFLKYLVDTM